MMFGCKILYFPENYNSYCPQPIFDKLIELKSIVYDKSPFCGEQVKILNWEWGLKEL